MKTVDLKIDKLRTDTDAEKATQALRSVAGVLSVIPDLEQGGARVEGQNLQLSQLCRALENIGFEAEIQRSPSDAEERLYVDANNMELSNNFWCHMGRYLHARSHVEAMRAQKGSSLRILDAASGTGYGTYLLSRAGDSCDGVDLSAQAIEFSRKLYGRENCRFTEGSVLQLPFEDATFDLAISFETLEHLPREQQSVFVRELRRVLKSGGKLVLSAPVSNGGAVTPEHNHHHAYEPDAAELVAMVESVFGKVNVRGQLVSALAATPAATPGATPDASSAPTGAPESAKSSAAHKMRDLARATANQLLKSSYLEKPATLQTVMGALYPGYLVKPLDLQVQRATFVVLEALV